MEVEIDKLYGKQNPFFRPHPKFRVAISNISVGYKKFAIVKNGSWMKILYDISQLEISLLKIVLAKFPGLKEVERRQFSPEFLYNEFLLCIAKNIFLTKNLERSKFIFGEIKKINRNLEISLLKLIFRAKFYDLIFWIAETQKLRHTYYIINLLPKLSVFDIQFHSLLPLLVEKKFVKIESLEFVIKNGFMTFDHYMIKHFELFLSRIKGEK